MHKAYKVVLFLFFSGIFLFSTIPVKSEQLKNTIYVAGNEDLYPLEYYQTGKFHGEIPRLLQQISAETGLEFVYLPPVSGVTQYQRAKNLQVEMVSCLVHTEEWDESMNVMMTRPLYHIPLEDGSLGEVCFGMTNLMTMEQKELFLSALYQHIGEPVLLNSKDLKRPKIISIMVILLVTLIVISGLRFRKCKYKSSKKPHLYVVDEKTLSESLDELETISRPLWYLSILRTEEKISLEKLQNWCKQTCMPAILGEQEAAFLFTTPGEEQAIALIQAVTDELYGEVAVLFPLGENDANASNILSCVRQGIRLAQKQEKKLLVCKDTIKKELIQEEMLRHQLYSAIEKEQFELYLQPIISTSDDKPIGAEALIRWDHPSLGLLAPIRFLELITELGMERELDHYQLRRCCHELAFWEQVGRGRLCIHCNVSRKTLSEEGILEWVDNLLIEMSVPAESLTFELTGRCANREILNNNLQKLKERGIRLALDKFSITDATNLEDLELHIYDVVKIDCSLIHAFSTSEGWMTMQKIMEQIHKNGAVAVCEGVESFEEVEWMRELGCDMLQGFYFYRPLPQHIARQYLLENK